MRHDHPDLQTAGQHMVRIAEVFEPRRENRATCDDLDACYLATYPALRDLMHAGKE
jgi:hypothetical protein